jgi:hypothetical protein
MRRLHDRKSLVPRRHAPLTETGRLRLARAVSSPTAGPCDGPRNASRSRRPTAQRRADRYRLLGGGHGGPFKPPGLQPRRTPTRTERRIIKVRFLDRWGSVRIAHLQTRRSRKRRPRRCIRRREHHERDGHRAGCPASVPHRQPQKRNLSRACPDQYQAVSERMGCRRKWAAAGRQGDGRTPLLTLKSSYHGG